MKRWLLVMGVIALVLGVSLWRMGDERDTRAVETGAVDREPELARDVAELEVPVARTDRTDGVPQLDEPAREALAILDEQEDPLERVETFHVVDGETKVPLAASVEVLDASGKALIRHPGYASTYAHPESQGKEGTPAKARVVRLWRAARLSLRVDDRRSGGRGPLDVRIRAEGWPADDPVGAWSSALDPGGATVLEGLRPKFPLTVELYEANVRIKRLEAFSLGVGEERELTIELGSGSRIFGLAREANGAAAEALPVWLLPAESPLDNAYLRSMHASKFLDEVWTDAGGRFVFSDVAPGEWWVGPAPADLAQQVEPRAPAPIARLVTLAGGQEEVEVTLEVHRGLTIEGTVVGPQGELVPHAGVRTRTPGLQASALQGVFLLGPLGPGSYELIGSAPRSSGLSDSDPVRAQAGESEVVLRLRSAGGIAGVVLGLDGRPARAAVEIVRADDGYRVSIGQRGQGTFGFEGLQPGVYHVCAHDESGNVGLLEQIRVEAEQTTADLVVRLTPGATVRVLLPPRESGARRAFRVVQSGVELGVGISAEDTLTLFPGQATVDCVTYDPETRTLQVLETREIAVAAGEQAEVVFGSTEDG